MNDITFYAILVGIPAAAGYVGGYCAARSAYLKKHKETVALVNKLGICQRELANTAARFKATAQVYSKVTEQQKHLQRSIDKHVKLEQRKKVAIHKLIEEMDTLIEKRASELIKEREENEPQF